jgi:acyl carrier protein
LLAPGDLLMSVEGRLDRIFREILEIDDSVQREDLKYNQFEKWDSLAHMSLVSAIEGEFDCIFETEDILAMSDFQKAVEITKKYHVGD